MSNIEETEHRTSNVEPRLGVVAPLRNLISFVYYFCFFSAVSILETKILINSSVSSKIWFSPNTTAAFLLTHKAVSSFFPFNIRCWTFDVRCSSFKTILYDVNATCECLQNKLALMGRIPYIVSYPKKEKTPLCDAQRGLDHLKLITISASGWEF